MALLNEPTLIVYMKGYNPHQLCLGHLVIGDWYHQPLEHIGRSCKARPLDESELAKWTLTTDWKGQIIARKSVRPGSGIDLSQSGHIHTSIEWTGSKILEAEEGRRIELEKSVSPTGFKAHAEYDQSPQRFLEGVVFFNLQANAKLRRWLSIARTDHMFRRFCGAKPKIWMLTALYELQGMRTSMIDNAGVSIDVGVNPALIGASSGIALESFAVAEPDTVCETDSVRLEALEPLVYAGRWQQLEPEYIRLRTDNPPNMLVLHRNNVPLMGSAVSGVKREGNKDRDANTAKLRCIDADAQEFHSSDAMDPEYWKEFDKVGRMLQGRR